MHYKATTRYKISDQLERDKLYTGRLLTCGRCHTMVTQYYFDNPEISVVKILCKVCKLQVNPPILKLREYAGYVWNRTQERWEKEFTIDQFDLCGWFLREHTIQTPTVKVPLRGNTNLYTLEHYGNRKCIRFKDYPFYYNDMTECITSKCRDIY